MSGRRMRVDTTVVETNIHYPTDSSLMGDGVRVLTRAMKKITKIAGEVGTKLRNRSRSVKLRVLDIARAARAKGPQSRDKLKSAYGKLLSSTSRVVGQAKRFAKEIAEGVKRASDLMGQLALDALRQHIDEMVPRVRQVMKQTRARIYRGETRAEGKIVSLFEPTTEVIRKGKAAKPTEFGKMIKLQEAENQIVIEYEVYDRCPNDADLRQSKRIRRRSDACRTSLRRTQLSTPARTRPPRKPKVSNACAFQIAQPRAPNANASRRSVGSATARNGAPAARGASASPSGGTVSTAADIEAMSASNAGSDLGCLPTTSSILVARSKTRATHSPPAAPPRS